MFEAERAYAHAANLAFPRRTGSPGEQKAARYIAAEFRALGLAVEEQPFQFSAFPLTIALRLALLCVGGLVLLSAWIFPHAPGLSLLPLLGVGFLTLAGSRWNRLTERLYDGPGAGTSRNVIARRMEPGATPHLIFLAHYDSKSQSQPLVWRLSLFLIIFFGLGFLTVFLILAAWKHLDWISPRLIWGLTGTILGAILLLQLNFSHNVSPGALDNACGVGVLLELARCLPRLELPGLNLLFVATGAEEEGLVGAMRFMQTYRAPWDPARSWFVNLDGPGAEGRVTVLCRYGLPPRHTGPLLTTALLQLATQRGLSARPGYLPVGAGTDQIPIAWRGFETVTLQSVGIGPAWRSVHSRRDTLEHLSQEALQHIGDLCVDLAQHRGNLSP